MGIDINFITHKKLKEDKYKFYIIIKNVLPSKIIIHRYLKNEQLGRGME